MNLNETPSSERTVISFFGCMNAGKSSLVNAVTGQDLSVVSEIKGTTTDPVRKTMELLPIGPVVIIDTPGFDDSGTLGDLRVRKAKQIMNQTDIAVLVIDGQAGWKPGDRELLDMIKARKLPYVTVLAKADSVCRPDQSSGDPAAVFPVSALTGFRIHELKEHLASLAAKEDQKRFLIRDLIKPEDTVILVCPIDESAPKGRLILPQQQMIRDILDAGAMAYVTKETELASSLAALKEPPAMVVTDSQAFKVVAEIVPDDVPLTSFSILMARYKGCLETAVRGVSAVGRLKNGDRILMAEGCTHHRQCNDIGTVKIPKWLRAHTGLDLEISTCSGHDFPEDLTPYSMIIHCGGCMITEREVRSRMRAARDQQVPFTNYGITIAQMTGILERSVRIFPQIHGIIEPRLSD